MDARWRIKLTEFSQETVGALPFFEELRVLFTMDELVHQFPILLEHYLRREVRQRLADCTMLTTKAEFHVQAIINYLENSSNGVFVIDRHFPPDLAEDRGVLLKAFERTRAGEEG